MHCPLQLLLVNAYVAPYSPAAHEVHTAAPAVLYWPGVHADAVAFVEPLMQT